MKTIKLLFLGLLVINIVYAKGENAMSGLSLTGKKIVMVIAPKNFRDEELNIPKDTFIKAGGKITIASTSLGVAIGKFGANVNVDILIKDVQSSDYDAIVIVGGSGSKEYLWENKELHLLLRKMQEEGKLVCAICASPVVLAKAGVITGKDATVFEADEYIAELKKVKANYIPKDVVVYDRIVTGNGPQASLKFAEEIIGLLKLKR
ncbi:MAG: DJ-1/PfpI family protein [Candidatus Firestonebacteria bacterium]